MIIIFESGICFAYVFLSLYVSWDHKHRMFFFENLSIKAEEMAFDESSENDETWNLSLQWISALNVNFWLSYVAIYQLWTERKHLKDHFSIIILSRKALSEKSKSYEWETNKNMKNDFFSLGARRGLLFCVHEKY